jgi:hypothetical protein
MNREEVRGEAQPLRTMRQRKWLEEGVLVDGDKATAKISCMCTLSLAHPFRSRGPNPSLPSHNLDTVTPGLRTGAREGTKKVLCDGLGGRRGGGVEEALIAIKNARGDCKLTR